MIKENVEQARTSFDFDLLPVSLTSRAQLRGIARSVDIAGAAPRGRRGLLDLILAHRFDEFRQVYVPCRGPELIAGMLPSAQLMAVGSKAQFFSNALYYPAGLRDDRGLRESVTAPKLRIANIGFCVVTLEQDCDTGERFEENLAWTRAEPSGRGVIARLDAGLMQFMDYRGVTAVYSGRRSIHFHFVFSTSHLEYAPVATEAVDLGGEEQLRQAAILNEAYKYYYDCVLTRFHALVGRSGNFDPSLRRWTQWRRLPWGMRVLEEDWEPLGLRAGMVVPQLVLTETLRSRAAPGSVEFLVPRNFARQGDLRRRTRYVGRALREGLGEGLVQQLQRLCAETWDSQYPEPVAAELQNGQWLIRFRNHAGDRNPSTIVAGDYRTLLVRGRHDLGDERFFLPDGMSADELIEHIQEGQVEPVGRPTSPFRTASDQGDEPQRRSQRHPFVAHHERQFGKPVPDENPGEAMRLLRGRLTAAVSLLRDVSGSGCHTLLRSVEGIGKTHSKSRLLTHEILDDAMAAPAGAPQRFGCLAFRSIEQAEEKAREHRALFGPAVVVKSVRRHYEDACATVGMTPLSRSELQSSGRGLIGEIRHRQPAVFDALEAVRQALWRSHGSYNAGTTMLFLAHASATRWHQSTTTRIWHHPGFDPDVPIAEQVHLREDFHLSKVVFDEPDLDEVLFRFTEQQFRALRAAQEVYADWRNQPRYERQAVHAELLAATAAVGREFESFDEHMRLDLSSFEPVKVDLDRIPFGRQAGASDMYRKRHGQTYHFGVQPWLLNAGCEWIFLTTEELTAEVIEAAYAKLDAEHLLVRCDLIPSGRQQATVPMFLDRRASKRKASELIDEILCARPGASIIADGVRRDGVTNFMTMKGSNAYEEDDLFILPTFLNPDAFALLNATGVYIDRNDVIGMHYADQLNQAVGRNRGFRQSSERATATVVAASPSLYNAVLKNLPMARFELHRTERRPW